VQIEIDQSGKIEQTAVDTVIALSNDIQASVLLYKRTKRDLQKYFRASKKYRAFPYLVFSACIAFLIKEVNLSQSIVIDREYYGHEPYIEQHIILFLERLGVKGHPPIRFSLIGKSSNAHKFARKVGRKRVPVSRIIEAEKILALVFPTKK
jgi:hypothetical protein